ncbi:hypothetical protein QAD02_022792 [Eretmocerus hayati]|uniref:Uncharacterized protein n=1 Tax=Eretmocerus hayati TaxID=131215 RepID=A0ACC2PVL6_9HYME|nr:hypothetical protein QAD02_022792 [Eretmocerus hayati]
MKRLAAQEDWSLLRNCDCGNGGNSDGASDHCELDLVNQLACQLVDEIPKVTENSKIVIDKGEKKRKSWITIEMTRSIKKRDEMYREAKSNNGGTKMNEWKKYRNILTTMTKEAEADYRKLWEEVNSLNECKAGKKP